MSIEAMKQALEALEDVQEMMNTSQWFNDRVTALRQAIEQAEKDTDWEAIAADQAMTIAMLKQREWVGLTDEDIKPLCDEWGIMFGSWAHDFARAIEAKLKEKNHG